MKMTPLSLGNIILLKEKGGMRESIPRQVDKKSRVPEKEKGAWGCQGDRGLEFLRRKRPKFPSTFLIKDYITTMYPAEDTFLLPSTQNLLTNLVILKCTLREWV